ncbi:GNAT family N-acetyltransferase [Yinghuangia soli]|uniref:GNAT family N-acetyltransferase n=1 Tax=Yinghuangia soli TaxID=2908204 RepID=A0AA41Q7D3_9ACTN|nr:GNAT family N-acetyltransferase [Yinghuangia soli]MCF2532938.1 GNAT family N-acetyltransferase [Yinghuangia soli]
MNRITPEDVGRRVSVRRLLSGPDEPVQYGDVVGDLTGWADGVLTITRRDGSVARVAERTLVAGKVVPPAPARGPAAVPVEALQSAADRAWPAVEYAGLGDWRLRASAGFTRRANSVLVTGSPDRPLPDAVAAAEAWYADRGLPAYFQVVAGSAADRHLAEAGWEAQARAIVQVARLGAVADLLGDPDAGAPGTVELADAPDRSWMARYHKVAAEGPGADAARHVLAGPRGTVFAQLREPGQEVPTAIGRATVDLGGSTMPGPGGLATGLRVVSYTAIEVDPAYRRRGLGRRIMAALTRHALDAGATTALLSVEDDNEPAVRMYAGLGFAEHHRYHYRVRTADTGTH